MCVCVYSTTSVSQESQPSATKMPPLWDIRVRPTRPPSTTNFGRLKKPTTATHLQRPQVTAKEVRTGQSKKDRTRIKKATDCAISSVRGSEKIIQLPAKNVGYILVIVQ